MVAPSVRELTGERATSRVSPPPYQDVGSTSDAGVGRSAKLDAASTHRQPDGMDGSRADVGFRQHAGGRFSHLLALVPGAACAPLDGVTLHSIPRRVSGSGKPETVRPKKGRTSFVPYDRLRGLWYAYGSRLLTCSSARDPPVYCAPSSVKAPKTGAPP